jgi:alpha-ketoglutarate-dependent taurine dioxygenase
MSQVRASLELEPLHPLFAAKLHGLDLSQRLSDEILAEVLKAFETHSVLVFPTQDLDAASQVAFSEHFGQLVQTAKGA